MIDHKDCIIVLNELKNSYLKRIDKLNEVNAKVIVMAASVLFLRFEAYYCLGMGLVEITRRWVSFIFLNVIFIKMNSPKLRTAYMEP